MVVIVTSSPSLQLRLDVREPALVAGFGISRGSGSARISGSPPRSAARGQCVIEIRVGQARKTSVADCPDALFIRHIVAERRINAARAGGGTSPPLPLVGDFFVLSHSDPRTVVNDLVEQVLSCLADMPEDEEFGFMLWRDQPPAGFADSQDAVRAARVTAQMVQALQHAAIVILLVAHAPGGEFSCDFQPMELEMARAASRGLAQRLLFGQLQLKIISELR